MSIGRAVALTVALLAMLAAGLWIGGHPSHMPPLLREAFVDETGGLTAEASELIEDDYYRPVSKGELSDSSLQGMVRGLRRHYSDRFSEYFSPGALERFDEEISGRFSGVGMTVTQVADGLEVQSVFKGSPAERAGIEAGETIVSVDGHPIAGESSQASTERIKGPEGSRVTLGVRSGAHGKAHMVDLTREQISVPVVSSRLKTVGGRRLGYLRMASFTEGVHAAVAAQVGRLQRQGAEGLVLDLRGNGGGLLDEAVLTASVFLPKGETVVSTRSRSEGDAVYKTKGGNLPALPIVVLIDRNTASAAEILTAALADDAGAKTVGTRSYGKGVFQQEVDLSNGGALKLTVGQYYTPTGVNLAGKGIHPDVRAPDPPGTRRDEGLERAQGLLANEAR
jgi:carboxyl-terminal processing protease